MSHHEGQAHHNSLAVTGKLWNIVFHYMTVPDITKDPNWQVSTNWNGKQATLCGLRNWQQLNYLLWQMALCDLVLWSCGRDPCWMHSTHDRITCCLTSPLWQTAQHGNGEEVCVCVQDCSRGWERGGVHIGVTAPSLSHLLTLYSHAHASTHTPSVPQVWACTHANTHQT